MKIPLPQSPQKPYVIDLFEQQVKRTPDSLAVVSRDRWLSFEGLNRQANHLAHWLLNHGVGPEVPVALFVERSLDMAVGVLGILKAGGAYVPLDTDQAMTRQMSMLEDCGAPVIVTQRHLSSHLSNHQAEVVCMESLMSPSRSPNHGENPSVDRRGDQMAYIMYTSGTTGRPKGVIVEHRNLTAYVQGVIECMDLPVGASFAMVQPLSFDASVTSMFPPWILGGCLHLLSREQSLDPEYVQNYFEHHPMDCLKITPSHLSMWVTASPEGAFVPKHRLIVGGEAVHWNLLETIHRMNPECRVFNHYGPTEGTVGISAWQYHPSQKTTFSSLPPIGTALKGGQLYPLEEGLKPVTEESSGNLFIGGEQVARGYWNRPRLTAASFLPNPFSVNPSGRMYRTGDVVRRLADGSLMYGGRRDRQIKIRGVRIEPGEVETVLSDHPSVKQAIVEPYKESDGRHRLAAYVVLKNEESLVGMHVLHFLRQRLPDAMVPSSVVFLDAIPQTPQGKVDRKALPSPEASRRGLTQNPARPRNKEERVMRELWEEVLGIAPIGVEENFFDLGGDSFLATTLIMRIRRDQKAGVSIRTILDYPTIEGLTAHLRQVSQNVPHDQRGVIPRVSRDRVIPLSFSQERIWYFHQLHPAVPAYHFGMRMDVQGHLNVEALKRSLQEVVRRHEIYRTTIASHDGMPTQHIHDVPSVEVPFTDLSRLSESARTAETERYINEFLQQPFDLSCLPLVRWSLLQLAPDHHVFIHAEHHMVHDGWATDVFVQELFELYNAFSQGKPSPLSDPPIQYADFTCWQREWMESSEADQQRQFWRNTLKGCQAPLSLPTTYTRPHEQTYRGARESLALDDSTWEGICGVGRKENVTPFMVMLSAFYVLLHAYTGQTDINVGTAAGNRRNPEMQNLFGMVINNLVLRVDLTGDPSFRTLLQRVRETTVAAYEHDDLPFHHVVDLVGGPRDPGYNPLFQAMFNFHDTLIPDMNAADMTVTLDRPLDTRTAKFDLTVVVFPGTKRHAPVNAPSSPGGTWMNWEYNTDLFDAATITRFVRHYETVLKQALAAPDSQLSRLYLLDSCERQQLLVEGKSTEPDHPGNECVHHRFESQVARNPDAVALVIEDQQLTYATLNSRANQLAQYLKKQGVGPEELVGVCLKRSPEMIVAMLGVLKAGGTYVPLDPEYSEERLSLMWQDAKIKLFLTHHGVRQGSAGFQGQVIWLDADWSVIRKESLGNPRWDSTNQHGAYVIYTSGTTGRPKGVLTAHHALNNQMRWLQHHWPLSPDDRVVQKTSFNFDASLWEILWPLMAGARLILAHPEGHRDSKYLRDLIQNQGITNVFFVPSMLSVFLEEFQIPRHCRSLRRVLCGGEVLSVQLKEKFLKMLKAELVHMYGPTEASIAITGKTCMRGEALPFVPLGSPVDNTQIMILNQWADLLPLGAVGEMCAGGRALGRGYLNRPGETAEKFRPHPYGALPGERMYRTGDRGRFRDGGHLEFVGRLDHQVKLGGNRIELGEIEAHLRQHPQVQETIVVCHENDQGHKQLMAYLTTCQESEGVGEIREYLQKRLPGYMIPSAFVVLEEFPLTSNGKVNTQALSPPQHSDLLGEQAYVAPKTTIEKRVAEIWREVLGGDQVGVNENFFEVGGHSLSAMRVIIRIRSAFKIELPASQLFRTSTISSLASCIEKAG